MKFEYRIIWTDLATNDQNWCDTPSQEIAIFIAKEQVAAGMLNVIIQVVQEYGDNPYDATWPAIDA